MDIGGLVSRKKDFIPNVTRAVKAGWAIGSKRSFEDVDGSESKQGGDHKKPRESN
jgi:hypothetical protein